MVENDMCLRGTSKQNALFPENVHKKKKKKKTNASMPRMSRIGPGVAFLVRVFLNTNESKNWF